jgi:alginate O-acetyltransferase complex protein AlgI
MLTMLIGGLWHGAAWTFVVWGAYHGVLLCCYRVFARNWDGLPLALWRATMVVAVVVGWVSFRSTDFHMAGVLLSKMFAPVRGLGVPNPEGVALILAIASVWALFGPNPFEMRHEGTWLRAAVLAVAFGACLAIIADSRTSPFLYFQF